MAYRVFLFPGQGAQKVGMGQQLCESNAAARQLFESADQILGYSLSDICWNGPKEKLDSTAVSQPALYVTSLAALESLKESEPEAVEECRATAGLSLGEYTALVFAGAMTFEDGLQVVQRRGEAMQAASDATPSGMVSILAIDRAEVEELVQEARKTGTIEVANLLCPGNTVVSGEKAACDKMEELAAEKRAKTIRLAVAGAFHTSLMKPADEALAEALSKVTIQEPRIPVWSNVDAQPHTSPDEIRSLLIQQVLSPVRWEETMRGMLTEGCETFYEIGPGPTLTGLLKRVQRKGDYRHIPA